MKKNSVANQSPVIRFADWGAPRQSSTYKLADPFAIRFSEQAILGLSVSFFLVGMITHEPVLVAVSFAIFPVAVVLIDRGIKNRRRIGPSIFAHAERQPESNQRIVNVELSVCGRPYGFDHGVLTVDDQFILFEGRHTHFALSANTLRSPDFFRWTLHEAPPLVLHDDPRFAVRFAAVPVPTNHADQWQEFSHVRLRDWCLEVFSKQPAPELFALLPPRQPVSFEKFISGALLESVIATSLVVVAGFLWALVESFHFGPQLFGLTALVWLFIVPRAVKSCRAIAQYESVGAPADAQ